MRQVAVAFFALLSVTLHVVASGNDAFLTCRLNFDIHVGDDISFVHNLLFFHQDSVVDPSFALNASEVFLVEMWCRRSQIDLFLKPCPHV